MAGSARTYAIIAGIIIAAIAVIVVAFANPPRSPVEPKSTLKIAVVTDALFGDEG